MQSHNGDLIPFNSWLEKSHQQGQQVKNFIHVIDLIHCWSDFIQNYCPVRSLVQYDTTLGWLM